VWPSGPLLPNNTRKATRKLQQTEIEIERERESEETARFPSRSESVDTRYSLLQMMLTHKMPFEQHLSTVELIRDNELSKYAPKQILITWYQLIKKKVKWSLCLTN
jgi:hypothetical protein